MMQVETYKKLQKNLMMFYTGVTRSANRILSEQKKNITEDAKNENIKKMCALTEEMKMALESNFLLLFFSISNIYLRYIRQKFHLAQTEIQILLIQFFLSIFLDFLIRIFKRVLKIRPLSIKIRIQQHFIF